MSLFDFRACVVELVVVVVEGDLKELLKELDLGERSRFFVTVTECLEHSVSGGEFACKSEFSFREGFLNESLESDIVAFPDPVGLRRGGLIRALEGAIQVHQKALALGMDTNSGGPLVPVVFADVKDKVLRPIGGAEGFLGDAHCRRADSEGDSGRRRS